VDKSLESELCPDDGRNGDIGVDVLVQDVGTGDGEITGQVEGLTPGVNITAVWTVDGSNNRVIKYQATVDDEYKYVNGVYGTKIVQFLSKNGAVIARATVTLEPENSIRPAKKYRIRDGTTDKTPEAAVTMLVEPPGSNLQPPEIQSDGMIDFHDKQNEYFPQGKSTITFKANGYEISKSDVFYFGGLCSSEIFTNMLMNKKFVPSSELKVMVSLRWAEHPKDLDLHMWDSHKNHCFHSTKGKPGNFCLD